MNIIDKLIENIIEKKNPVVVGLDPDLCKIPFCYKHSNLEFKNPMELVSQILYNYNKDVIDVIYDLVPAVKPQIAFYEKYGYYGIKAFEETVKYAKSKGLVVIEDGKRNDIGNTALAYAEGHLGTVEIMNGMKVPSIDVDFLTVSPFLGSDSLMPFIKTSINNNKGVFILVKTSNASSSEIQDIKNDEGQTVSEMLAETISKYASDFKGKYNYSSIGAVVGATFPEDAKRLRELMPNSFFLVPGYGAQGGNVEDILPSFNTTGLGAIVNSSRGILYLHMSDEERKNCTKQEYLKNVRIATKNMQKEIYETLGKKFKNMLY